MDRNGRPLTIKLTGPVEAWFEDLGDVRRWRGQLFALVPAQARHQIAERGRGQRAAEHAQLGLLDQHRMRGNANAPMNRLIVKPIPHRTLAPHLFALVPCGRREAEPVGDDDARKCPALSDHQPAPILR